MTTLQSIYHNPKTGLGSEASLYRTAKQAGLIVTHKQVKEFLNNQRTAQVFLPSTVKHSFPLVQYNTPFARTQIDLLDLSNESPVGNHGFKWIFCCIDIASRYAYGVPMKNKTEGECLRAFKVVLDGIHNHGYKIIRLDSDNESAFRSNKFRQLCSSNKIEQHFSEPDDHRATAFVERFNRTLRMLIERYKVSAGKNNWVDALPSLISNYNSRVHSSIGVSPLASVTNFSAINNTYLQDNKIDIARKEKLNSQGLTVGDRVRTLIIRKQFDKGTAPKWSKALHKIERIEKGDYYVSERISSLKAYQLLKVDSNTDEQEHTSINAESEQVQHRVARQTTRRFNKEGIVPVPELKRTARNRNPSSYHFDPVYGQVRNS